MIYQQDSTAGNLYQPKREGKALQFLAEMTVESRELYYKLFSIKCFMCLFSIQYSYLSHRH